MDEDSNEPVSMADAPCDHGKCKEPWAERVEFAGPDGSLETRFMCKPHASEFLLS